LKNFLLGKHFDIELVDAILQEGICDVGFNIDGCLYNAVGGLCLVKQLFTPGYFYYLGINSNISEYFGGQRYVRALRNVSLF